MAHQRLPQWLKNLPISLISVEVNASEGEGLVVSEKSGIKSMEDLKGSKIAVAPGSSAEAAMMNGLDKYGIRSSVKLKLST